MRLDEAEIVLDTAESGAVAGVRSLGADGRQIVFRHGGLEVEVMLQTARPWPVIWGRVVDARCGLPCFGARVTLVGGIGDAIPEDRTDDWGEFCLVSPRGTRGVLCVESGERTFVCSLDSRRARVARRDLAVAS